MARRATNVTRARIQDVALSLFAIRGYALDAVYPYVWLDVTYMKVRLPFSRISEGPSDGGHALALEDEEDRSWFAVPAAAIPMLRSYISAQAYGDLLGRTPKLRRNG